MPTQNQYVSHDDIESAWKYFVSQGHLGPFSVSPEIARSWERCNEARVNPYDGTCQQFLSSDELSGLRQELTDFIEVATPFMAKLYRFVQGSGFIVVLTDERGYVLEVIGDEKTLNEAKEINFVKGANWSEQAVGTNAIGTAIVLRKPLQTTGAEHYCLKHQAWTCSACPIFNQDGKLLGVLDLSGPSSKTHLHTLGMVVAASEAIMEQLKLQKNNRELTLADNRLNQIFQTMSEGVMIFDENGVVTQVNPIVEQIFGQPNFDLVGKTIMELVGEKAPCAEKILMKQQSFNDIEIFVDTRMGRIHCMSSGKPIVDDQGVLSGGVILLKTVEKVQNLVNRFSGAQASFSFKDIIGKSEQIQEAIRIASLAAANMSHVLLEGESGTGKEVFAQAIHNRSMRRDGPFVAVNCGAIPRELIGSELFGYADGAFTGAKRGGRPGKFELASGGTLFLDEIGDMPLEQQVALLRVIQDKKVTRIGDEKVIPVDVRIICATNKHLLDEVEKGNFRKDLYYRLNVVPIEIPSLSKRKEDIPLLFRHLLDTIGREWGREFQHIEPEVMEYLQEYNWPGNVRELQNVVERIISMADGDTVCVKHLPSSIVNYDKDNLQPTHSLSQNVRVANEREKRKKLLAEKESQKIMALLAQFGGNVSQVAREMGVSRNTLYRKMHQYNIAN
ncbi:MAG: sigma-54-dependent Fis family transcriptional regulator [Syntrophomonadaceae bacterium]